MLLVRGELAFVFVAASAPLMPRLRASLAAAALLDAVNVASLALMAVVAWQLGRHAHTGVSSVARTVAALLLLRVWGSNGGSGTGP